MIESEIHFFGGFCYMGTGDGFAREYVTQHGSILDDRDIRLGGIAQNKIPWKQMVSQMIKNRQNKIIPSKFQSKKQNILDNLDLIFDHIYPKTKYIADSSGSLKDVLLKFKEIGFSACLFMLPSILKSLGP